MAGAFQTDAFQNDAFQVAVVVRTGGGITILRRPRIFDELPTRILEPVAGAAVATFWSIAVIDWVIPLTGILTGRSWTNGVAAEVRSYGAGAIRSAATLRGSRVIESEEFRQEREDEEVIVLL